IIGGYPWSVLPTKKRESSDFGDLRMPGWLPTTIIANIVAPKSITKSGQMEEEDCIRLGNDENGIVNLSLPLNWSSTKWEPNTLPIEIIDGQHRLFALDNVDDLYGDYELPVVAFYNLDITWQAYLFYTINIKPKRINKSLAYDLYPLLRIQDWLDKETDSTEVYRETRAQELTEILWVHPESPWKNRINMLGDPKEGSITQAAFLRSLTNSYVKSWEVQTTKIGGLFGARLSQDTEEVLDWSRTQQAAFLILVWQSVENSIKKSRKGWAIDLRKKFKEQFELFNEEVDQEPAFVSKNSLFATDQGVRGIMQVTNDIFYVGLVDLGIKNISWDQFSYRDEEDVKIEFVTNALRFLKTDKIKTFLDTLTDELMDFDWRTSSTEGLTNDERLKQMTFRGSGGYKELRKQLLTILSKSANTRVKTIANKVKEYLGL
ncbi:MAG: DGQHR domain-containing protein, partial [Sphingobacteriales bacterium]